MPMRLSSVEPCTSLCAGPSPLCGGDKGSSSPPRIDPWLGSRILPKASDPFLGCSEIRQIAISTQNKSSTPSNEFLIHPPAFMRFVKLLDCIVGPCLGRGPGLERRDGRRHTRPSGQRRLYCAPEPRKLRRCFEHRVQDADQDQGSAHERSASTRMALPVK